MSTTNPPSTRRKRKSLTDVLCLQEASTITNMAKRALQGSHFGLEMRMRKQLPSNNLPTPLHRSGHHSDPPCAPLRITSPSQSLHQ